MIVVVLGPAVLAVFVGDWVGVSVFLDCKPPTTPPTTAAETMRAKTSANNSQKCFFLSPHILLSWGSGGTSAEQNTLSIVFDGIFGVVGLKPPVRVDCSGDIGDLGSPATGKPG